ncbi:ABC transporter permease [Plantactinospora sp. KBS50]|nr:ABC transporter permease [Plantactinospora sp. KBS50]
MYGEADGGTTRSHRAPAPALDDVFDDPAHGEPGRDRIGIHVLCEILLLVAAVVLGYLLYRDDPATLRGHGLRTLLVSASALGLLTLGAGVTLRAAVPNLALGPVVVAAGLYFAENGDQGVVTAMIPAVLVAAAMGLAIAVLVVGFHVPSWAASLAAALGVMVFIQQRSGPVPVQGGYDPTRTASYLFGGFAVLAVLAGMFGSIRSIRRMVGRFRPVADPARRRGVAGGVVAAAALVASMVLATAAGVLFAANGASEVRPTTGLDWTGLAIGAAMLGGTSAYGRRGGVFGTLLSVLAVTLFLRYSGLQGWNIALAATAAITLAGGLVVTRLVEAFGRPRATGTGDSGEWATDPDNDWSASTERSDSWSATLPAQPAETRPDPWDADRWGSTNR